MLRPVRISIIAISVVLLLLSMQVGVEAKKKTKRKKRTTGNVAVVVVPLTVSPAVPDDSFVNNAAPSYVAPSSPASQGGM